MKEGGILRRLTDTAASKRDVASRVNQVISPVRRLPSCHRHHDLHLHRSHLRRRRIRSMRKTGTGHRPYRVRFGRGIRQKSASLVRRRSERRHQAERYVSYSVARRHGSRRYTRRTDCSWEASSWRHALRQLSPPELPSPCGAQASSRASRRIFC